MFIKTSLRVCDIFIKHVLANFYQQPTKTLNPPTVKDRKENKESKQKSTHTHTQMLIPMK